MDKLDAKKLNADLSAAVQAVFDKYNLQGQGSQIRYNDATVEFKITGKKIGDDGTQVIDQREQAAANWYIYQQECGFGGEGGNKYRDILGRNINIRGLGDGKVVAFNNRGKKFSVVAADGKRYAMNWATLKQATGLTD